MMRLTLATAVVAIAVTAAPAFARTIRVSPGPGTPLQDAIDAAAPGDKLRLAPGVYSEAIVIDKALTLKGPGLIDGGCGAAYAVDIQADDVDIIRMAIYGGTTATVNVDGRKRVRLKKAMAFPSFYTSCPADYGYNVVGSSEVRIEKAKLGTRAEIQEDPYTVAYIRVADVAADGAVVVRNNFTNRPNGIGILIENAAAPSGGPGNVEVKGNLVNGSGSGIVLHNADGTRILANKVYSNATAGISLDAASDGNRVQGNDIRNNSPDVVDAGTGNCWKNNEFTTGTVAPCP
jgi:parallel beta-helix repeat protein